MYGGGETSPRRPCCFEVADRVLLLLHKATNTLQAMALRRHPLPLPAVHHTLLHPRQATLRPVPRLQVPHTAVAARPWAGTSNLLPVPGIRRTGLQVDRCRWEAPLLSSLPDREDLQDMRVSAHLVRLRIFLLRRILDLRPGWAGCRPLRSLSARSRQARSTVSSWAASQRGSKMRGWNGCSGAQDRS